MKTTLFRERIFRVRSELTKAWYDNRREEICWSSHRDLNPEPVDYETTALPLSHASLSKFYIEISICIL